MALGKNLKFNQEKLIPPQNGGKSSKKEAEQSAAQDAIGKLPNG